MKLNLESIRALWKQQLTAIEIDYLHAACQYADCIKDEKVIGISRYVFQARFDCAIHTRNKMLGACATDLLSDVDDSVIQTEAYSQYLDTLIDSTECLDLLLEKGEKKIQE